MALAPALGRLGAPAVLVAPPAAVGTITGVRRDVAAFFGVSTRGPCRERRRPLGFDEPIRSWLLEERPSRTVLLRITSWDEYRQYFGGFEGPGRLPYAVSSFFDGGGQAAYVARIVHDTGVVDDRDAIASGRLRDLATALNVPIDLTARTEGAWGNRLSATLTFETRPVVLLDASTTELVVDQQEWVPGGSLLRLHLPGGFQELRTVERSEELPDPDAARTRRHLTLEATATAVPTLVEVVTGRLEVVDKDPSIERREVLDGIGFRADHPRWLARSIIDESRLVWPGLDWIDERVVIGDIRLEPIDLVGDLGLDDVDVAPEARFEAPTMRGGVDRWHEVVPEDFFDPAWVRGDEVPGDGVQSLADHVDVGLVLAPDLYQPEPFVASDDVADPPTLCGATFTKHLGELTVVPAVPAPMPLTGLELDVRIGADRDRIVANQRALVDWATDRRDLTVLLDVPPGLSQQQMLEWRNNFDSPFAAAYHPWLDASTSDDGRDSLVRLNPSAYAAGIIADRERRLGVHFGPANEIAIGAVRVASEVAPAHHDALHVAGINVFQPERDGIRLSGARTLALRSLVRQLSVVRLMTVLRLSLQREMQWAVFEPNNDRLWAEVRRRIRTFLTELYTAGAFRGASTKEAFFVTCDRTTMTQNDLDNGRLICLVGVNVAEPIEYIVLEIALDADTTEARIVGA